MHGDALLPLCRACSIMPAETIFAFATAQKSPKIQQKYCSAFLWQYWVCSGNALRHSRIRHTTCRVCNYTTAKNILYCYKKLLFKPVLVFFGGQLHIYCTPKQYILHTNIIYITPSNHIYRHTSYAKRPFYDAFQLQNEILDCNDFLPSARYLHTKKAFCIHLYGICRRPAIFISSCSCYSS